MLAQDLVQGDTSGRGEIQRAQGVIPHREVNEARLVAGESLLGQPLALASEHEHDARGKRHVEDRTSATGSEKEGLAEIRERSLGVVP